MRELLGTLPVGRRRFWGIPFRIPDPWITVIDRSVEIALDGRASHVLVAHACDVSLPIGPTDRHPGQIMAVGELLAEYILVYRDGTEQRQPIRRRYEIGEVAVAWGQLPFAARSHRKDAVIDPRMTAHRASFGFHQTGQIQAVYEGIDAPPPASSWWLHAIETTHPDLPIKALRIEAVAGVPIALGGVTRFQGTAHPLRHDAGRIYRIPLPTPRDPSTVAVSVDLGAVGRRVRLRPPSTPPVVDAPDRSVWPPHDHADPAAADVAYEITATADAMLTVDGVRMPIASLEVIGERRPWVELRVIDDATGRPLAARVNVRTLDGVTLPPAGHAPEVNVHWFGDWTPDVRVGDVDMAYVDGRCSIEAPIGQVVVEAGHGFEYHPFLGEVTVAPGQPSEVRLRRAFDRGDDWMTADTHVHFLSPSTALLQAEAEDVDLVNLLATQWGALFTNVGDLGGSGQVTRGRRTIAVGSENRQHHLGHLLLLGTGADPVLPFAVGGPSESTIGDPVWNAVAHWAERGRARGGLAIAPHFPEPYSEVVADALHGLVDAVELRAIGPNGDGMDLMAWYALLNAGLRIGCVGGTDKMWAGIALGQMRTYARTDGLPPGFDAFAAAVRAGRTIATNGPLLDLRVGDREPGGVIDLPAGGGSLDVEIDVRSVIPVDRVELIRDGVVIADAAGPGRLTTTVRLERGGWLAARATGRRHALSPGWSDTVAAHTSPVYVTVAGQRYRNPAAMAHLDAVMAGGQLWLDTLATRAPGTGHDAIRRVFEEAREVLGGRESEPRRP